MDSWTHQGAFMSTYGAQQLASSFRTVRRNTIQVAQDIPEDKYAHVAAEGARTVGRMLTHVAIAPTRLWQGMHGTRSTDMTGFDFFGLGARMQAEEATPRTKAEIVELLTTEGEAFAMFLEGFSDAELSAMVKTYGAAGPLEKCRLEMLMGAKEHEMHHRAQLMLIERQLGIIPHLTQQMNARIEQMAKARAATV
jgi:uncharacterized damage-inducible protein DinB